MRATDFLAQLVRTRRFTLGVPARFTITADETAVLFLRSRGGDDPAACLWALDLDSGAERLLAGPAELEGQESAGVDGYAASAGTGLVAFTLGGALWAVDAGGGQPRRLPAAGPATEPRPDPAGQRIAYVSGGALRVIEADGTGDRAVLEPDGQDVTCGAGEHMWRSLDGNYGYWWAPDGSRLLVARVDSRRVALWYLADPADPAQAPRAIRYPAVGTANPEVTLWIAGLDGSRTQVSWDAVAFEYVPAAGWDTHGPYALVQSRDQQVTAFLVIDPASGQTTTLEEQRDDCWVQLIVGLPARTGSGALVSHRDSGGTRYLTVGGAAVTPPGLQIREVLGVDGDTVVFIGSDEPTQTHLWSYRDGEGIRRLSAEPGVHDGQRRGGTLLHTVYGADRPGGQPEVLRDDKPAIPIASLVERPVLDLHATMIVLGTRDLRARLHLPSWHRPGSGKLPVLADPYGGASLQLVTNELQWRSLVSQWFAEQGFAVLVADGSGTPGRGPDWEREVYGDLFGPVLDDQVTALREAARRFPDLDLGRVGIRGWSFGGSLAAWAVLNRPDVFHAAVAGAGVTDQLLYDAHWRERFLGQPDKFPERYQANSLVLAAPKLTRPLLLIHGLVDDNVHPANTLLLSEALLAAGREHEVLLLPGVGHAAMAAPITQNLLRHQVRFLQRHLAES